MANKLVTAITSVLEGFFTGSLLTPTSTRSLPKRAAEEQFRNCKLSTPGGQIILDGSQARILDSRESFSMQYGAVENYVLTLFVVTAEERYFLFKSNTSGGPYIKELDAYRAKLVLKEKFQCYASFVD